MTESSTSLRVRRRRTAEDLGSLKQQQFVSLNCMTLPMSKRPKCELCTATSKIACSRCYLTFYCSTEHFVLNMELHKLTCEQIKLIRRPIGFLETTEKRERAIEQRNSQRRELSNMAIELAEKSREQGRYDLGITASILASQECENLPNAVESLVKSLLITSECYIHKGNLEVADGFLTRAACLALEHELQSSVKALIRRNEGLAHLAKDHLAEAKACFSEEVYQTAKVYGPVHVRTTPGYYNLANLFFEEEDFVVAVSLLRSISDIWLNFTRPIICILVQRVFIVTVTGEQKCVDTDKFTYDEYDGFLGLKTLAKCIKLLARMRKWAEPLDRCRTIYSRAAIYFITEKYTDAKDSLNDGLKILKSEQLFLNPVYGWYMELLKQIAKAKFREKYGMAESSPSVGSVPGHDPDTCQGTPAERPN